MRNQGVDATEPTECYLVNLLADFTKAPLDDEPLGAQAGAGRHRARPTSGSRQLKDVGDTSLYVSGFFADSLQRSWSTSTTTSRSAAPPTAQLARTSAAPRADGVRRGLRRARRASSRASSTCWPRSREQRVTTNRGVVQLYERWLRTGSEWIERTAARAAASSRSKGDVQ